MTAISKTPTGTCMGKMHIIALVFVDETVIPLRLYEDQLDHP